MSTITIDLAVYPLDVVLRACHPFTSRWYVHVRSAGQGLVSIDFEPRGANESLHSIAGEFANALLDAHLRVLISAETREIRELLIAQAFCEADLLDRRDVEADEQSDPRRIAG